MMSECIKLGVTVGLGGSVGCFCVGLKVSIGAENSTQDLGSLWTWMVSMGRAGASSCGEPGDL